MTQLLGGLGDTQSVSLSGSLAHIQTLTSIGNSVRNCSVCTYENLMSNNFLKTAVLKKYEL